MDVLMVKLVVPVFRNVRLAVSIGHHGKEFLRYIGTEGRPPKLCPPERVEPVCGTKQSPEITFFTTRKDP